MYHITLSRGQLCAPSFYVALDLVHKLRNNDSAHTSQTGIAAGHGRAEPEKQIKPVHDVLDPEVNENRFEDLKHGIASSMEASRSLLRLLVYPLGSMRTA